MIAWLKHLWDEEREIVFLVIGLIVYWFVHDAARTAHVLDCVTTEHRSRQVCEANYDAEEEIRSDNRADSYAR